MKSSDTPPNTCYVESVRGYVWHPTIATLMYPCGTHCSACTYGTFVCSTCSTGFYKKPDESDQSKCYSPSSLYGLSADQTSLLPCPANCLECSALNTVCTACSDGNYPLKWTPVIAECQQVTPGQRYDTASQTLQSCTKGCKLLLSRYFMR